MKKIGATFLNKGVWNDRRIISEQWVEKSTKMFPSGQSIDIPGEDGGKVDYAYSWWTKQYPNSEKTTNMFWALGWGGQKIFVSPEVNTVIVFTGGSYTSEVKSFSILEKYVLLAIG